MDGRVADVAKALLDVVSEGPSSEEDLREHLRSHREHSGVVTGLIFMLLRRGILITVLDRVVEVSPDQVPVLGSASRSTR